METELTSPVEVQLLPALRVACYRAISLSPEDDGHAFLQAWIARQGLGERVREFGFDCQVTEEQGKAGLRGYEQWWVVPEHVTGSEGVSIRDFPGGLYAVMTLYHPFDAAFDRIPAGWRELMGWVETSDAYAGAEHQWLEELIPGGAGDDLKLYIPIKPK